jgi:hypothetical protein
MNALAARPDGMGIALPTVPVTSGTQPEPANTAILFPATAASSR